MRNIRKKGLVVLMVILVTLTIGFVSTPTSSGQEKKYPREQTFRSANLAKGPRPNFNPLQAQYWGNWPYEQLAYIDWVKMKLRPWLAEEWSWVDDYTFEIKIRPEAHFRKGQSVDSEDVRFSMNLFANKKYSGSPLTEMELIKNVEVINDKTLHLHVKEEYPPRYKRVKSLLTSTTVLPKAKWSQLVSEYGENILNFPNSEFDKMNGSGPYTAVSNTTEATTWKRVDNWWGNKIGLYTPVKYYQRLWAGSVQFGLKLAGKGELDYLTGIGGGLSTEWLKSNVDKYNLNVYNREGPIEEWLPPMFEIWNIGLNPDKEIFRQRWLRRAIAYSINYEKLIDTASIFGVGVHPGPYHLWPDLPRENYYNVDLAKKYWPETELNAKGHPAYFYSPETAKEILREHCEGSPKEGWTITDPVKNPKLKGKKISDFGPFKVMAWQGPTDLMNAVDVISKYLNDIGIKAEPYTPTYGVMNAKAKNFNFDIRMALQLGATDPIAPAANAYQETFLNPGSTWMGSKSNYWKYWTENYPATANTADEVRDLVNELWKVEAASKEAYEIVRDIQDIVIPQAPVIMAYRMVGDTTCSPCWVNWNYKDDKLDFLSNVSERETLGMHRIRPKDIKTVNFTLSPKKVKVGETVTAKVTLKNEGGYKHLYPVYIRLGEAEPGINPEDILTSGKVDVPAKETRTIEFKISMEKAGTFTLNVDDWRVSKYDPGDPIEKTLIVEKAENLAPLIPENLPEKVDMAIKTARDAKNAALSAKDTAQEAVNTAEAAKNAAVDAKTAAQEAKAAAKEAGGVSASMLVASMIVTIIVVLAGVYAITRKQAA